jgi:hypothetical protein
MNRALIPLVVSDLIGGRPVRWVPTNRLVGDYDGRERTLQIFNADPKDQRRLLDEIDKQRGSLDEAAGGPLVIIFHSVKQSTERYADFVRYFVRPRGIEMPRAVALSSETYVDAEDERGPHRRPRAVAA